MALDVGLKNLALRGLIDWYQQYQIDDSSPARKRENDLAEVAEMLYDAVLDECLPVGDADSPEPKE